MKTILEFELGPNLLTTQIQLVQKTLPELYKHT